MDCLEFKRLALSDPGSKEISFIEHGENCADCLKYVGEIKQMDLDLARSLDVRVPVDLAARLQLSTELNRGQAGKRLPWAMVASLAVAVLVGGLLAGGWLGPAPEQLRKDYQILLAGVVDHINEEPITPVWDSAKANSTVNTLLASYDTSLRIDNLDTLQYGQICPMGKYKGLHATLETEGGQTTFAYFKGEPIEESRDAVYDGYLARIKPVSGGNLVIVSKTRQSLDQAESQLSRKLVWDI
jgi:hypothetical protein